MNDLEINYNTFDKIKHTDEFRNEYWNASELMLLLEYSKWENFHKVIKHAMIACEKVIIIFRIAFLKSGSQ